MTAPTHGVMINWSKVVPLNVRCFIWRALLRRVPVNANLRSRGISVQSELCSLCEGEKETVDHLFVKCKVAEEVQDWILQWCGTTTRRFQNMEEFLDFGATWGNCPKKKEITNLIFYCTIWHIWKARNNKVFNKVKISSAKIADDIISQSFEWYKYRSSKTCNKWIDWSISPFNSCQ